MGTRETDIEVVKWTNLAQDVIHWPTSMGICLEQMNISNTRGNILPHGVCAKNTWT